MPAKKKASEVGDKRGSTTFATSPQVNRILAEWMDENGGSKTKLLANIVFFFAAAPDSVKEMMVGRVPSDMRSEYQQRAVEWFSLVATDRRAAFAKLNEADGRDAVMKIALEAPEEEPAAYEPTKIDAASIAGRDSRKKAAQRRRNAP